MRSPLRERAAWMLLVTLLVNTPANVVNTSPINMMQRLQLLPSAGSIAVGNLTETPRRPCALSLREGGAEREEPDVVDVDGDQGDLGTLFDEPDGFFEPAPQRGSTSYSRAGSRGDALTLVTAARSPLWGHLVWNAARVIADYIDSDPQIVHGKQVAELGAGAGLPSLISALNGAAYVMMTDFPDADLIETVSRARPLLLM